MGKTLRVGMVGGSLNSFMGEIHRQAIARSGCLELVCGAFGSTRNSSYETGKQLGLPTRRVYGTYRDLFRREAALSPEERIDFATVITPNAMHYPIAMSAIDAHFPIFCEKPFTCNMDEALNLTRKQQASGIRYGIAMVLPCYPMFRKARSLIQEEQAIGVIRKVVVSCEMGWMAPRLEVNGNRQAGWRSDPRRSGQAGCVTDLGAHCFYAAEWLTGLTVSEICADTRPTVPGRILDDDCTILLRFENGIRGVLLASQIETGSAGGITAKIIGSKGTLIWRQADPDRIRIIGVDGSVGEIVSDAVETPRTVSPECPPTPFGNNEAYIQALTDAYIAFAEYLTAGKDAERHTASFMSITEGLRSVAFVDAVLKNTAVPPPPQDDTPPPPLPPKWMPLIIPAIP